MLREQRENNIKKDLKHSSDQLLLSLSEGHERQEHKQENRGQHHNESSPFNSRESYLLSYLSSQSLDQSNAHLVGFLHQIDLAQLQDDRKVDGFLAHPPWFLVEIHLLKDLTTKNKSSQCWTGTKMVKIFTF